MDANFTNSRKWCVSAPLLESLKPADSNRSDPPYIYEVQMKLEYLADGSFDCPLIRLYDFNAVEAEQMHAAVSTLASEFVARVEVHRLPFVESIGLCRLAFVTRTQDKAIRRMPNPFEFECGFTSGTWENVAGLMKPFAEGGGGFQWLARVPGEVALLLTASASGEW